MANARGNVGMKQVPVRKKAYVMIEITTYPQELPELDSSALKPHYHQEGQQEHRLNLESKSQSEHNATKRTLVLQKEEERKQHEGTVDNITLAPPRAVEYDGGAKQGYGHCCHALSLAAGQMMKQKEHYSRGHEVKGYRGELKGKH